MNKKVKKVNQETHQGKGGVQQWTRGVAKSKIAVRRPIIVLHEGMSAVYKVRASQKENKFNRGKTTHLANTEALEMFK